MGISRPCRPSAELSCPTRPSCAGSCTTCPNTRGAGLDLPNARVPLGAWIETAVSVRGGLHYLYRAVDKNGKTVASVLRADRGMEAAQDYFRKAVASNGSRLPRKINLDGNAASHRALRLLAREDPGWRSRRSL
ncbi:MAG: DDE-type integrase/transposase/recombinase [Gammaproteobacteria bacterium]|nr:MAG: DDE-type integrase/transposase/recombinase [Gammaproteobacteria bacterium]